MNVNDKEIEFETNYNWDINTEYLVLVNYYKGDIEWRKRLLFSFIVFSKEMPVREPYNATNQAKSETNLLKFIYEFYDCLPQNIINVHQYEIKPYSHDGSLVDILNDKNFVQKYKSSHTVGFWNFCSYTLGHAASQVERMIQCGWWKQCMEPWFGSIETYYDFTFMKKGCAQFVVSRERIRSLPKEFYKNMYDWLVTKSTGCARGVDDKDEPFSNFYTSRYMEWTWELIFAVYKPRENKFVELNNGVKLRAIYGAGNYQIDVSNSLIQNCIKNQELIISQNFVFNEYFGDPIYNTVKNLHITVLQPNGKQFEYDIAESHNTFVTRFEL